jgi:nucleotide-binding universal stress UspA family protein
MYRHVLLTVDGSDLSRSAIPHAAKVAGPEGEITVVEVVPTERQLAIEVSGAAFELTTATETLADHVRQAHFVRRRDAERHVQEAVDRLRALGVRSVRGTVAEGLAGNSILEAAGNAGAEAIVMATRGHSRLGREVLGSVAEYVLRHAGPRAVVLVGPLAPPLDD